MIDTHVHTILSGHAYSTLEENARAAAEKGLEGFVITDHSPGPANREASLFYLYNMNILPRDIHGVKVFRGVEANICTWDGELDLDQEVLSDLEVVIASLHKLPLPPGTREDHTRAYLKAMENPHVRIIGHPDDCRYPYDVKSFVRKAGETGTVIEVNNSSLLPTSVRYQGAGENYIALLGECKKQGVPVTLGSDAHFSFHVGRVDMAKDLLKEQNFPMDLVVNRDLPSFLKAFHLDS